LEFAGVSFGLTVDHYTNYVMTWSGYDTRDEWEDALDRLYTCFMKYFLTASDEELDVEVIVTFYDDAGTPQTPSDDIAMTSIKAYVELDDFDTLSSAAEAYLDSIATAIGADYYTWSYLYKDVVYRMLFPDYMTFTLTAEADPFSAEVVFDDVSTGIQFKEATLSMSDVSLCCGITHDVEVVFNKCDGFDHLTFTIENLFSLCCGISFDLEVEFGTTYKQVTLTPSIDWSGECLNVGFTLGWESPTLDSISVNYIGITCEYGECLTLAAGTAFPSVSWTYDSITGSFAPDITLEAPSDWGLDYDVITLEIDGTTVVVGYYEYEYFDLTFCGPGCCGGQYSVDVKAYWGDRFVLAWDAQNGVVVAESLPTLFGLSRIEVSAEVPVIGDTLTLTVDMSYSLITNDATLDFGWSFSF